MADRTHQSIDYSRESQAWEVDRICEQFESELRSGNQPKIEHYLDSCSPDLRDRLTEELIFIEVQFLEKAGNLPAMERYLERFPGAATAVRRAFSECQESFLETRVLDTTNGVVIEEVHDQSSPDFPKHIGRYEVIEKLGSGGFGVVVLAEDTQLKRRVAIKVPHRHLISSLDRSDLYIKEARIVASLDHPSIVPVFDVGATDEFPCFIVSKFINSVDFGTYLRRHRPSSSRVCEIVAKIADALDYAHQQGLVHRDVKPSNILIDAIGVPHLVDFGLAIHDTSRSQRRELVGTPAYMSPEQAMGEMNRIDSRSDLFSLGVVLYESLSGRRPFESGDLPSLLTKIQKEVPEEPWRINQDIPRQLSDLCMKCLQKDPVSRVRSAADLAAELSEWSRRNPPEVKSDRIRTPKLDIEAIDFSFEIDRLSAGFSSRSWIDAEIGEWLNHSDDRIFVVYGGPGAGKSSFLANMVKMNQNVVAHHFCNAGLRETLRPDRFVQSVVSQLVRSIPDLSCELEKVPSHLWHNDPGSQFRRGLAGPLSKIAIDHPAIIVVDGLDEAIGSASPNIAELLADLASDLPAEIRIVVGSRRSTVIEELLYPFDSIDLSARRESREDCRKYINLAIHSTGVRGDGKPPEFADSDLERIQELADGNFLVASQAMHSIIRNRTSDRTANLTADLGQYFRQQFTRLYPDRSSFEPFRGLIAVLLAATRPLQSKEIAGLLGISELDSATRMESLSTFFPDRGKGHSAFHKSVSDWLTGRSSNRFRISVEAGHARFAGVLTERLNAGLVTSEVCESLLFHLIESRELGKAVEVLKDLRYISGRIAYGQVFRLLSELGALLDAEQVSNSDRKYVRTLFLAIRRHAHFLVRNPRSWFQCLVSETNDRNDEGGSVLRHVCSAWMETGKSTGDWVRVVNQAPLTHMLATLEGHRETVNSVAVSPSRSKLFSGGNDGRICVWDLATGSLIRSSSPLGASVLTVDVSPTEERIVVAIRAGGITLRDERLNLMQMISIDGFPYLKVRGAKFVSDSRIVIYGDLKSDALDDSSGVLLYDLESGTTISFNDSPDWETRIVEVDREGGILVSADGNGEVKLWRIEDQELLASTEVHRGRVAAVSVDSRQRRFATASRHGTLSLRCLDTGRELRRTKKIDGVSVFQWQGLAPSNHKIGKRNDVFLGEITALQFIGDGRYLAVGTISSQIYLVDSETLEIVSVFSGHQHWLTCLGFARSEQLLVSGSADLTVRIWDATDLTASVERSDSVDLVAQVAMSRSGRFAVSATTSGRVSVWDVSAGAQKWSSEHHDAGVSVIAFGQGDDFFVTGSEDGRVCCWSVLDGLVKDFERPQEKIVCMAIDDAARLAVAGDAEGYVRCYFLGQSSPLFEWRVGDGTPIRSIAIESDGTVIAVDDRWSVRVWSADTGRELERHEGWLSSRILRVSDDGRELNCCKLSDKIRSLDNLTLLRERYISKEPTVAIATHRGKTVYVCRDGQIFVKGENENDPKRVAQLVNRVYGGDLVSINCDTLVCAHSDTMVGMYDLNQKQLIKYFECQPNQGLTSICIDPRRQLAVGACRDGSLLLFDPEAAGADSVLFLGQYGRIVCTTFSEDGRLFAAGGASGRIDLWTSLGKNVTPQRYWETNRRLSAICISPQNDWIYSGHTDGTIGITHISDTSEPGWIKAHADRVRAIVAHPFEPAFFSIGNEGIVRRWDRRTLKATHTVCDFNTSNKAVLRALLPDSTPTQPATTETEFYDKNKKKLASVPYRLGLLAGDESRRNWIGSDGENVILFELMSNE